MVRMQIDSNAMCSMLHGRSQRLAADAQNCCTVLLRICCKSVLFRHRRSADAAGHAQGTDHEGASSPPGSRLIGLVGTDLVPRLHVDVRASSSTTASRCTGTRYAAHAAVPPPRRRTGGRSPSALTAPTRRSPPPRRSREAFTGGRTRSRSRSIRRRCGRCSSAIARSLHRKCTRSAQGLCQCLRHAQHRTHGTGDRRRHRAARPRPQAPAVGRSQPRSRHPRVHGTASAAGPARSWTRRRQPSCRATATHRRRAVARGVPRAQPAGRSRRPSGPALRARVRRARRARRGGRRRLRRASGSTSGSSRPRRS